MASTIQIKVCNIDDKHAVLPGASRVKMMNLLKSISSSTNESSAPSPKEQLSRVLGVLLESATAQRDRDLGRALLRAGADVAAIDMYAAVKSGQVELAHVLAERGASVSVRDEHRQTPLHIAAENNDVRMTRLLLEAGADIDDAGAKMESPLHSAAEYGSFAVVSALLAAGADPNLRDDHGSPPILVAASYGNVAIVKAMLDLGVDVNVANDNGWTPLHHASKTIMVDMMVEAGAEMEARDLNGQTPLSISSGNSSHEAVRALISHGADVNAQDAWGCTPLYWAAVPALNRRAAEAVDLLLKSGADETIANADGRTAIDVVGTAEGCGDIDHQGIDRVCDLLANAPADRAWRRRGLLLLCVTRSRNKQSIAAEGVSIPDASSVVRAAKGTFRDKAIDSARLAVWVSELGLGMNEIFRTIVAYL